MRPFRAQLRPQIYKLCVKHDYKYRVIVYVRITLWVTTYKSNQLLNFGVLKSLYWRIIILQPIQTHNQGIFYCWWWYLGLWQISRSRYLHTKYVSIIYWDFIACSIVIDKTLYTKIRPRILTLITFCGRRRSYFIHTDKFCFAGEIGQVIYSTLSSDLITNKWSFGVCMLLHVSKSLLWIHVQLKI